MCRYAMLPLSISMTRYSLFSLMRHALRGHQEWTPAWRTPDLASHYDVVIVGGGGHGLASAYYLANNHHVRNIAVLESGWLGGGNTGRNTTIIRSDYQLRASGELKELSLQLWETLSPALNFNLMVSQRGYVDLAHDDGELEHFLQRANAMRMRGVEVDIIDRAQLQRRVPMLDCSPDTRFPVVGALLQERGGTVRHDAVAWGFARAADANGVSIFQNCPVVGLDQTGGRVTGVKTPNGVIGADAVLISVAGRSSELAAMAGIELPLESINVQAFVSEPVKPVLDCVVNFNAGLAYISQTDKGELVLGGASDGYNSFARRGSFFRIENVVERAIAMFPSFSRLRLMRQWAGTADIPMDGNAIVGATPLDGLYLNAGWGYAGFKATPAVGYTLADTIAKGRVHPLLAPFSLDRFARGALIDDAGAGPYPYLH